MKISIIKLPIFIFLSILNLIVAKVEQKFYEQEFRLTLKTKAKKKNFKKD